ncbi:MAG: N-formylglutamate deformylase [Myxococcota bacterium]
MKALELHEGEAALVVSIPHDGREVPPDLQSRFTPEAARLPDTDWHVRRLYDFAIQFGATVLAARWSRFVVDLNRPPDQKPLYPGRFETALVPTRCFDGHPIYRGAPPNRDEIEQRRAAYWQPYHDTLSAQLRRIKRRHGLALLWDAHSIPSRVPSLFEGRLPDLNVGSAGGRSCAPDRITAVCTVAARANHYGSVRDGRFKGGYITRQYGRPAENVHALQLELVQDTYMDEGSLEFDDSKAERLRPLIRAMLEAFCQAPGT